MLLATLAGERTSLKEAVLHLSAAYTPLLFRQITALFRMVFDLLNKSPEHRTL